MSAPDCCEAGFEPEPGLLLDCRTDGPGHTDLCLHRPVWPQMAAASVDCEHSWSEQLCPCGFCYRGRCGRCAAHYFFAAA
jgi:hypothetical protein